MKRPSCKESKDNNPNWGEKMDLPESKRIHTNGVVCFSNSTEKKVTKYYDSGLYYGDDLVGYSSIIE